MSSTSLTAGEVMDRSAALLNDPAKTDYTYIVQLPYLNMAIDELLETLADSNISPTVSSSVPILLEAGKWKISPIESTLEPHYPPGLIEIQEVTERTAGTTDSFARLVRYEFHPGGVFPRSRSLLFWHWESQFISFNPGGALEDKEIQLKYIHAGILQATDEHSFIGIINAGSFLTYKTASLCAQFIGENETRAGILDAKAEKALERMEGISNKGRQQIMTRHRPFRASWKARGGF